MVGHAQLTVDVDTKVRNRPREADPGSQELQLVNRQFVQLMPSTESQQLGFVCIHPQPVAAHPCINTFNTR